jgi:hypothetical protein
MIKLGETTKAIRQFEGHKCEQFRDPKTGKLRIASNYIFNKAGHIDVSWLPLAAEKYNISADIRDYVINEIPIVTVDVPNRNLDAFPFEAVTAFNPEIGRIAYQTFIGKPTHRDHDNKDIRKARGVHFDASMEKLADGMYKIVVLAGWDRTKDAQLVSDMLSGRRTGFSMGAFVGHTECSFPGCKQTSPNGRIACSHQQYGKGKGQIVNGQLIYELCHNINYIETSSVGDPADHTAHHRWQSPWSNG